MKYLCYDTALNEEYTLVKLLQVYPGYISLFAGTDDAAVWDAAPYLFEVADNFFELKKDPFVKLDRCIIFETRETKESVCRFLQYYIYHERYGASSYFRIWDAAVLLKHLQEWEAAERQSFFDFFNCFYTESRPHFLEKWTAGRFYKPVAEQVPITEVLQPFEAGKSATAQAPHQNPAPAKVKMETISEHSINEQAVINEPPKKRRFFIE
ncbi:MAG: DUF4123 domain-containing protein [Niabella sp.]